jgi:Mg-chelatase subunit ChlD
LRRLGILPRLPRPIGPGEIGGVPPANDHDAARVRSDDDAARINIFDTPLATLGSYGRIFRNLLRRFRRAPPGARRSRRRQAIENPYAGRNIRLVPYEPAENLLAPLPTVLEALRAGRRFTPGRPLVRRADLLGWAKAERESLTLILLVDVSRSTIGHLRVFAELLRSLAGHFQRNRDRMGLVSLQGRQATVLHHPTHNYRIVTRHLAQLRFRGETPLADGLQKTLAMARLERFKNPGSQSLVVLLSDCFPEPIPPGWAELFESPAYRAARTAASLFRREKVQFLVLLAAPERGPGRPEQGPSPGERLGEAIAAAAAGRLMRLPHAADGHVPRREIDRVLGAIEAMVREGGVRAGTGGTAPASGEWWRD